MIHGFPSKTHSVRQKIMPNSCSLAADYARYDRYDMTDSAGPLHIGLYDCRQSSLQIVDTLKTMRCRCCYAFIGGTGKTCPWKRHTYVNTGKSQKTRVK